MPSTGSEMSDRSPGTQVGRRSPRASAAMIDDRDRQRDAEADAEPTSVQRGLHADLRSPSDPDASGAGRRPTTRAAEPDPEPERSSRARTPDRSTRRYPEDNDRRAHRRRSPSRIASAGQEAEDRDRQPARSVAGLGATVAPNQLVRVRGPARVRPTSARSPDATGRGTNPAARRRRDGHVTAARGHRDRRPGASGAGPRLATPVASSRAYPSAAARRSRMRARPPALWSAHGRTGRSGTPGYVTVPPS